MNNEDKTADDFSDHFADAPWWARMIYAGIARFADLVPRVLQPWPTVVLMAILCASLLGHQALLPEESRDGTGVFLDVAHAGSAILASGLFCLAGWILCLIFVPLCFLFFVIQHKRIKKQGTQNARLMKLLDPDRASSKMKKTHDDN